MKSYTVGLIDLIGRRAAVAAIFASLGALPFSASAQDEGELETFPETVDVGSSNEQEEDLSANDSTELGTLQVTGSRLRRTDFETANPVLVLTREDIERTGLVSIGDILQNLPQAGAALNTAFNNGGTGATEIDLRNLGSNRVLVLVNGRRWVGGVRTLNTSGVDLNTIPISIIDSIEILKDGASAIYGSDAIAGVINIKTRRDFSGFEVRGQYEILTEKSDDAVTDDFTFNLSDTNGEAGEITGPLKFEDDGQIFTVSVAAGSVSRNSSSFIDISYTKTDEVFAGSRTIPSYPQVGPILGSNQGGFFHSRGSLFTPGGNLIFVPTNNNSAVFNAGVGSGLPNDPDSICYPIADAANLATGIVAGELGIENPVPNPNLAGVDLCVAETLNPIALPNQRAGRPDYGHQYVPFDFNLDGYNFAPINYLITPQERTSIFGQYSFQISPDIRLSTELLYNQRRSEQQLAHQPLGAGDILAGTPFGLAYVASDNPYNPTNPQSPYYLPGATAQDIGRADPASELVGFGGVVRRILEAGPRIFTQKVDTMRIGGGLDGQFFVSDRFFAWDAGAVFNESTQVDLTTGEFDMLRVARALGPLADCIGEPNSGVAPPPAADGCVPLDLFGPIGSITQEQLDYVTATVSDNDRARQAFAYANVSTEFDEFSNILAGPLGMATGVEFRKEFFESVPDSAKVQGTNANLSETPTKGAYDVKEAYLELGIPILEGIRFAEGLNVSLAGRYSEYGILDRTFTNFSSKFGLEYRPLDQLLVRATVSEAFRAPAITDLFLGASLSFPSLVDPCSNYDTDGSENAQQNCADDGVPAGYTQGNSQLPSTFGGNPDLTPEDATTKSLGFVWSPPFIDDFNITMDWYNVTIDDVITFPGAGQVLLQCYESDPNNRSLCNFVDRDAQGNVIGIQNVAANLAQLEVEGVDVNLDWRLPFEALEPFGSFKIVVDVAYTTRYQQSTAGTDDEGNPTTISSDVVGIVTGGGGFPRVKINGSLDWERGPWNASWATRYIHHAYEPCDDGRGEAGRVENPGALANPTPVISTIDAGLCDGGTRSVAGTQAITNEIEAIFYHDFLVGYDMEKYGTSLTFGIRNVFNTQPPLFAAAFSSSYDPTLYEFQNSRSAYLRFVKNF